MQWLCCQLCYVTVANQRTIVEIQILATVSWTCGCQPFSCPCSQNVMHCRKEICWTSLFKESISAILFGNSEHPIPTRSYCIMPIPSLQLEKKIQSHAQKQRVWSLSCGLQDLLQCSDCALSCALWLLQTNDSIVEIELLATVSWTCGCQLSAADVGKVSLTPEKRFMRHRICLRNPFLPFLLGIPSIQSLPEATASCPSLHCSSKKRSSPMHRNRGCGHWVVVSKICYNAVIVLSVVLCDCCKPMIQLSRLSF